MLAGAKTSFKDVAAQQATFASLSTSDNSDGSLLLKDLNPINTKPQTDKAEGPISPVGDSIAPVDGTQDAHGANHCDMAEAGPDAELVFTTQEPSGQHSNSNTPSPIGRVHAPYQEEPQSPVHESDEDVEDEYQIRSSLPLDTPASSTYSPGPSSRPSPGPAMLWQVGAVSHTAHSTPASALRPPPGFRRRATPAGRLLGRSYMDDDDEDDDDQLHEPRTEDGELTPTPSADGSAHRPLEHKQQDSKASLLPTGRHPYDGPISMMACTPGQKSFCPGSTRKPFSGQRFSDDGYARMRGRSGSNYNFSPMQHDEFDHQPEFDEAFLVDEDFCTPTHSPAGNRLGSARLLLSCWQC